MAKIKIGLIALAGLIVVAQVFRIDQTNPPVEGALVAPPQIEGLMRRACYDCHSNETVWPWYSSIAPVSWLVARDVKEGREELNFSRWGAYDDAKKIKKLKKTAKGEMPPWYYVLAHPEAGLSPDEQHVFDAWITAEIARPAH
jgi:hypothetical protein